MMATAAQATIDRAAAGLAFDISDVPSFQWGVYWDELRKICPSSIAVVPRPQRNALRIEILPSTEPRCSRRSPDSRGLAWLLSGGDPLAYGECCEHRCPRARLLAEGSTPDAG